MRRTCRYLTACVGFAALLCGSSAWAQTAPSLGDAASFAVLAGSTVTNTGSSTVTGDVGVSPGNAVTGFPPGVVVSGTIHIDDTPAADAQDSVTAAYNNLAGQSCTQDLTGQDLGGLTLTEGVYCFSAAAQLTGTLTLDAEGSSSAVFIFQIGSALTTASGSSVDLINGGSECNVFWQVGSSATLGTSTSFLGNILALTSVTLNTGADVEGRTLARNGAVTLDSNDVTATCAAPPVCPTITVSPATLPDGTEEVAYDETITGSGGTAPYTFAVTSGALPGGLTLASDGELSGTPTSSGTSTFTIRATDANDCFAERSYTIDIEAAPPPPPGCEVITLTPTTLPNGTVGVAYSQTIAGNGGTAPYSFSVTAGELPTGLTLGADGVLDGTPTTEGEFTARIRATDAEACFGERSFTMFIIDAVPTLPQVFVLLLALALTVYGYFRLRRQAQGE